MSWSRVVSCKVTLSWAVQLPQVAASALCLHPRGILPVTGTLAAGKRWCYEASHVLLRRGVVERRRAEMRVKDAAVGPPEDITDFRRGAARSQTFNHLASLRFPGLCPSVGVCS